MFNVLWESVQYKDLADIIIVAILIYQFILIVQGTRAVQMAVGVALLGVLFAVSLYLKLYSLHWILNHFFNSFFIIVIIIFQDQIRTALASFGGTNKFFGEFGKNQEGGEIDEVVEACGALSREKIGALIVFEKNNGLSNYIATGTQLNSDIHSDLIYAIFQLVSPLHDGAIIISRGKIRAAGCFLPLSKNVELDRHLGTRHRAGLGLSQVTDAVVLAVSEERGEMTLFLEGSFYPVSDEKQLRDYLKYIWAHNKLMGYSIPIAGKAS